MFKKKSLILSMAMSSLLVAAACSNDAATDAHDQDENNATNDAVEVELEPVTYHYFNAGAAGKDLNTNETYIGKMLEEKTGVNFKVEHLVGDINQRTGVMIASGDYPDVIVPDAAIDALLDAGAFIPLNDLLEEHGPNLLEAYGDYLHMFTHDDGNIYYIPFGATVNEFQPNPNIDQGAFWIQRGILKEYGFPEINTLDEYLDIITRYAKENPEIDGMRTIPFTGLTYDWRFFAFTNVPNHLAGYPNDGGVMVDMDTHEASVYADSEYAKRWLKALNELNAEGLLDQEMFVMNYDEYLEKLSSGRVLGFFDYGWQFGTASNALRDAGNPDREYMALPVVFDEGIKDQYIDPPAFTGNRGVGITVNAENPERIIQFWDELIKEDNQRLVMWGIEGEHYNVDENGRFYQTEEQIEIVNNQNFRDEFGMTTFEWSWPRINGTFSDGNAVEARRQPEVAFASYNDDDKEYLEAYGISTFAELFSEPDERPWYPAWSANIEQGSPQQIFEERADEILRRHYARIVLADPADFDKEWDDFVQAYRSLDVDAYENFFTEVVQARVRGEW
ncbi:ABC transporter substrate-binding protein [Halalkalibacterium halodurans]|jgi:putative aldouronate transport system substrate-binding protein|uniref:BH2111 protein n=2 Tax=Halalkalibacterium halodurans TaxID=86665 RepID=Q9KB24_HALH5|nr:ABC transporter substrate-binding protein [Halalkalibacterium halodurans]MED4164725.1 ABC transporter substrate-binding protein [Halalkalibacterium halodurans]MED4174028.1 ABC transporter substrate-binding protein [Halalkalibacterium halodurans]TES46109.1 extracellular solute-binding protein [Halalkalibacterium halodurans]TPE67937.1 extracellular solute-binding protein [Halalkalibacterium halodurans]BAB05830.1 BH2111 [Halalkalibacterium halodurans C-125]